LYVELFSEDPFIALNPNNYRDIRFHAYFDEVRVERIEKVREGRDLLFKFHVMGVMVQGYQMTGQQTVLGPISEFYGWARSETYGDGYLISKSAWVENFLPVLIGEKISLIELPKFEPAAELSEAVGFMEEAWRHYRSGDYDEALTNCRKALESTTKAVMEKGFVKKPEEKKEVDWKELFQSEKIGKEIRKVEEGLRSFTAGGGPHLRPISKPEPPSP